MLKIFLKIAMNFHNDFLLEIYMVLEFQRQFLKALLPLELFKSSRHKFHSWNSCFNSITVATLINNSKEIYISVKRKQEP